MKIYQINVSLVDVPRLYRTFEATANATFAALHQAIFDAFERFDPHMYSFFITKQDTKNTHTILSAPEITHPENTEDFTGAGPPKPSAVATTLAAADLAAKDVFHYLFDFGDSWWHRLQVEAVMESPGQASYIKLIDAEGIAPPQYPEYEEDEDED